MASSSGERWLPEVLPEHPIFLSHSKDDKPFVERLCEELKRSNHSPFFDQNSDSLPRGERFTSHLFKAAEQCLVAVIVLSEGYLTSKWPLLELVTFVKAQRTKNSNMKLFPLFYKLSPSDLVPEKWMKSWEELELDEEDEIQPDIFPTLVAEAVNFLRPFNGLEFSKYGTSEGRFIQAVLEDESIRSIRPLKMYSADGIRGYQRMCEKASSLFQEGILTNAVCKPGCLYLGFYGMGGVGKTTLCEAMCSFHEVEFPGRVCHVELGSDAEVERIERLKYVIRQLGGCDDMGLEKIERESQALQCLHNRLKSQPRAFLAVDNVGDSESSRDEARRFISCGLACGSKVLVTSRSRLILESVLREAKYCHPIPRLEEQEAEELFLSVAIPQKLLCPLQPGEAVIVKACIRDSRFLDDGYDVHQYHPLVLRALGTFFHDVDKDDIMEWKEALNFDKKLQASRESKRVNDILGLNYAKLPDELKLLFLDVVLWFNYEKSFLAYMRYYVRNSWENEYQWAISLIAAMHGISTFEGDFRVKELQRKSLIYESSPTLRTHDLYIEFARSVVSVEGSKEKECWVGHWDANGSNLGLKRLLLFMDVSKICHPPKRLWECLNLECLVMLDCKVTMKPKLDLKCFPNLCVKPKLDLKCFPKLRVLIIHDYTGKAILYTSDRDRNFYGWKDQSKGCLPELRMVYLRGFDFSHLPFLKHCWNLTFLWIRDFDSLDFLQDILKNLKALEALGLSPTPKRLFPICFHDRILQCATEMKNLKHLEIDQHGYFGGYEFNNKLDLSPLGSLTSLQTLSLLGLDYFIKELVGLDQLSQLVRLNLEHSLGLEKLGNLDLLPNLRRMCVAKCWGLNYLEDQLERFEKLHSGYLESEWHQCLKPGQGTVIPLLPHRRGKRKYYLLCAAQICISSWPED